MEQIHLLKKYGILNGFVAPLLAALLLVISFGSAHAQEGESQLQLRLIRTFGYGGLGQIEGNFSMRVAPVEGLERVAFLFDDQVVFEDQEAPFEFAFHTGDFVPGVHTLSAVGYTAADGVLTSNSYEREFLTAEAANAATTRFIFPLLIGVGVLVAAAALVPLLLGRRRQHRPGQYGLAGGAVCPKCARPFSRGVLSPNLLIGKLERCPHCKKWSVVRRANPRELEAAEAFLAQEKLETAPGVQDEEEKMRRLIEDSRYE